MQKQYFGINPAISIPISLLHTQRKWYRVGVPVGRSMGYSEGKHIKGQQQQTGYCTKQWPHALCGTGHLKRMSCIVIWKCQVTVIKARHSHPKAMNITLKQLQQEVRHHRFPSYLRQIILSQLYFWASCLSEGSMIPPRRRRTRWRVDSENLNNFKHVLMHLSD